MFKINLPKITKLTELSDVIQMSEYHLYASIFEQSPKLSFTLSVPYETPDALGFYLGTSFPMYWEINSEGLTDEEIEKAGIEKKNNDKIQSKQTAFPSMSISSISMISGGSSNTINVQCENDYQFFQKSDIRKAYSSKFGNEVIEDLINTNDVLKKYKKNISKTDNASTVYRTLGDSDISFIEDRIKINYTINNDRPLFFIGLDGKVNFSSINELNANSHKTNLLIRTNSTNDDASSKFLTTVIENYVDSEDYDTVEAANFELSIGANNSFRNLKNTVYYTNFQAGIINTTGYTFKPALQEKSYFPVDKVFSTYLTSNQTVASYNRPSSGFCYEALNYFHGASDLIKVKIELQTIKTAKRLITVGQFATLVLPYTYSIYNGNYLVSEIEYLAKEQATTATIVLIRPVVDLNWSKDLSKYKDSSDFKYPVAPEIKASQLYSI